jgi:hypothetical protein
VQLGQCTRSVTPVVKVVPPPGAVNATTPRSRMHPIWPVMQPAAPYAGAEAVEAHRDNPTALGRSGGRPACRRAVASRPAEQPCGVLGCWSFLRGFLASGRGPGRQAAALHGRQDARRHPTTVPSRRFEFALRSFPKGLNQLAQRWRAAPTLGPSPRQSHNLEEPSVSPCVALTLGIPFALICGRISPGLIVR